MAPAGYDLASLLRDVRRDVNAGLAEQMTDYYMQATGADAGFRAGLACLGAQRNLRILGVFARLSMHFGKPHYVDLIPRVWNHLQNDLTHPVLAGIRKIVEATLPPPTPDVLKRLKDKCASVPTL